VYWYTITLQNERGVKRVTQRTENGKNISLKIKIKTHKPDKCENPYCNNTEVKFDHDHVFLVHRGWLCHGCNIALGALGENPDRIRWLAKYAEERCV
jgi:hypothetical protein